MVIKLNNQYLNGVPTAKYRGKRLVIGIDSSKTNTAISIEDDNGHEDIWELDGSTVGTSKEATLKLCQDGRKFLKTILDGSEPYIVGIEDIITKKEGDGRRGGIEHHESRFKITAIFDSFIFFFQDNYDITPELVNNWAWKSAILPEQFRSKEYRKGSLAYFQHIGSPLGNYTDDATDAHCIKEYLKKNTNKDLRIQISKPEIIVAKFAFGIYSERMGRSFNCKEFKHNELIDLYQFMGAVANHIKVGELAKFVIPVSEVPLDILYKFISGDDWHVTENAVVFVIRRTA